MLEIREIIFDSTDYCAAVALRHEILRKPLGLQYRPEDLKAENGNHHMSAYLDTELVGTLQLMRLSNTICKMRQVAVLHNLQGKGVGRKLVEHAESYAQGLRFQEIVLNARIEAVPFYLRLGYDVEGDEFTEVGIPHLFMRKVLLGTK